jgi:hypothetical protein
MVRSGPVGALFLAAAALLSLAGTHSRTRRIVMLEHQEPVCQHTQGLMQNLHQAASGRQQQVRASRSLDSKKEEMLLVYCSSSKKTNIPSNVYRATTRSHLVADL